MRKVILVLFIAASVVTPAVMAGCGNGGEPAPGDGEGSGKAQALVFTMPG